MSAPFPENDHLGPRGKTRRTLNARLLVGTLAGLVMLGCGGYAWHRFQVGRTAAAMLQHANDLADEGRADAAAEYLFRYLRLRPEDAAARIRLAETFDQLAKDLPSKERAVELYYQAIGVASDKKQPAMRGRLAELLLQLHKFTAAAEEARELLRFDNQSPRGWRLLALARYGQYRSGAITNTSDLSSPTPDESRQSRETPASVGETFERAVRLNPADVDLSLSLAEFYRENPQLLSEDKQLLSKAEREQGGDRVIDHAIAAAPTDAKAWLARYKYRVRYRLPQADDDLAEALKQGENNVEVRLVAAMAALGKAQAAEQSPGSSDGVREYRDEACRHYEKAIDIAPADRRAYLGLAQLYAQDGRSDRASETCRRGLEKVGSDDVDLNAYLADLLLRQGKFADAEKPLGTLERVGETLAYRLPPPIKASLDNGVALLRARWLVGQGRYREAAPLAVRVATGPNASPSAADQRRTAWLLLGAIYAAGNEHDLAANAYEQALRLQPDSVAAHLGAAAAFAKANRPELAAHHYEAARGGDAAAETSLALATALLQCQVKLPKAQRDWKAFQEAVQETKNRQATRPLAEPWRLALVEAEYALVQAEQQDRLAAGISEATTSLRSLESAFPKAPTLLGVLTVAYQRLGEPADADRALQKLASQGAAPELTCLLRATLCRARKQYDKAREVLHAGMATLPARVHAALQRELVQVAVAEGKLSRVRDELLKLHEAEPLQADVVCQLAELDLDEGRLSDVEQWEKKLRALQGADSLYAQYLEAGRLLLQAENSADERLTRALELATHVTTLRPAWPDGHLLCGRLFERLGKLDEAADAYEEAIRLGETRLLVYERLLGLLSQLDRVAEIDRYLSLLQGQMAGSQNLSAWELSSAARHGDTARAIEIARHGVQTRPRDFLAYGWLGQVLLAGNKQQEAEAAFQEAVRLAPNDPRALAGLIMFYIRTRQPERAQEVIEQISGNDKLGEPQRSILLAQGYELLGRRAEARAAYRKAAATQPGNADMHMRLAAFLLRGTTMAEAAEAEQILRRVLEQSPQYGPARRALAQLLVQRGGESQWREAEQLLAQAASNTTASEKDRRAQAIVLAQRGGRDNLRKAREIFEELTTDPRRTAVLDRVCLARLYEADDKLESARGQYLKLVNVDNPKAADVASYVDLLLRHGITAEAETWLLKLERLAPDDLGVTALRARWLQAQHRPGEIEPLVEALADRWLPKLGDDVSERTQFFLQVGNVYSAVEVYGAAERWYRRAAQLVPERYEPLAIALAQQGRISEAVTVCVQAATSDSSSRPARVLAAALLAGRPTSADFRAADPLLALALQKHGDDVDLLLAVGGVRVVQRLAAEATALYRQALRMQPKNVPALNNMATLLSEQKGKQPEAIEYIDRAMAIAGPQPALLDTKAMALFHDGKFEEAASLLEDASCTLNPDPRCRFHLAVAYQRCGDTEKARQTMRSVRGETLAREILTESDERLLAELQPKLQP